MNSGYIAALEKQCEDWADMYEKVKAERDKLADQLMHLQESLKQSEKPDDTTTQLRHV